MTKQSSIHTWADRTRETLDAHIAFLKAELEYALGLRKAFTVMGRAVAKPTALPEPPKRRKTAKPVPVIKRGSELYGQPYGVQLLAYMRDHPMPQTTAEIAEALGWTTKKTGNVIWSKRKHGAKIMRTDDGRWTLGTPYGETS